MADEKLDLPSDGTTNPSIDNWTDADFLSGEKLDTIDLAKAVVSDDNILNSINFIPKLLNNTRTLTSSNVKVNANNNLLLVDDAHATNVLNISSFGQLGYNTGTSNFILSAENVQQMTLNDTSGVNILTPLICNDNVEFKDTVTFDVTPVITNLSGLNTVSINANPDLGKYIEYKATINTNNLFTRNNDTGTYSILKGSTIGTASSVLDISSSSIVYAGNITNTGGSLTNASVTSTGAISGTNLSSSGQFLAANGSASAPPYAFTNDSDTGMYRSAVNTVKISCGNTNVITLDPNGVSGITNLTANDIICQTIDATTGGITSAVVSTSSLIADAGTVSAPSITFTSDSDTGIYKIGANNVGVTCGGGKVVDCATTQVETIKLRPITNNTVSLGDSTKRWTEVFATNALINTSDKNLKEEISDETLGLNFITILRPVKYKWKAMTVKDNNNEDLVIPAGNRFHSGLIAQEVKESLDMLGEDRGCYVDPVINNPNSIDPKSLRYEQMIGITIKALQEANALIINLQNRVDNLEKIINK